MKEKTWSIKPVFNIQDGCQSGWIWIVADIFASSTGVALGSWAPTICEQAAEATCHERFILLVQRSARVCRLRATPGVCFRFGHSAIRTQLGYRLSASLHLSRFPFTPNLPPTSTAVSRQHQSHHPISDGVQLGGRAQSVRANSNTTNAVRVRSLDLT